MSSELAQAKRLVVKVGSSLVTNRGQGLDHAALTRWVVQIAELRKRGREVILVSSGAIAEGMHASAGKKDRVPCTNCRPPPQSAKWV